MSFTRIAVIYNPRSGRPRERESSVARFATLLRQAGKQVDVCPTRRPNHATDLAREAIARGCDLVVANGGDGTMNEVLQAVVGTESTLCFWPGGTANVLAAEIRFPAAVEQVVERILAGKVQRVTVGKANDRYFLLMAGIGLDAAVAAGVDASLKKRLGKAAFGVAALRYIRRWDLAPFRVHLPDEAVVAQFAVAGNARSYGGGFRITPGASLSEPDLELCLFPAGGRLNYLRYALGAVLGTHRRMAGVTCRKVSSVYITAETEQAVPVQLDGEVTGTLPLTLQAIPEGVRLLY